MNKLLLTLMFVSFFNANAQNPVQEFNFNGNLNNTDNTISFLGTPTFVNDRMGAPKGALRLTNKAFQAVVGDLPQGNKPRTLSVWVKFNAVTASNYVFGYGDPVDAQYFGLIQQASSNGNSDLSLAGWGTANNIIVSVPLAKEIWYFYSVTFDGNTSKIYRNGELLKSVDGIPRLTKGYILSLGKMNATVGINADIDELRLYSVAMTDEQVKEAYKSSKPIGSTATGPVPVTNTVKKVVPVPEKTVASTKSTASAAPVVAPYTGSKNIEVFSQGKQLSGFNASNINDLPEGTYLIKVINSSGKK